MTDFNWSFSMRSILSFYWHSNSHSNFDLFLRANLKNSIGNVLTPFNKRIGFAFTETNKKIYSGHRNYVAKKYDDDPLETN